MTITLTCAECGNKWKATEWRVASMRGNLRCPKCLKKGEIQIRGSEKEKCLTGS